MGRRQAKAGEKTEVGRKKKTKEEEEEKHGGRGRDGVCGVQVGIPG